MYFAPSFLPFPGGAVTRIPESKRRRAAASCTYVETAAALITVAVGE